MSEMHIEPVNPVVFRDACHGLFDYAETKAEEMGDSFDMFFATAIFFKEHFNVASGGQEALRLSMCSSMRILALLELLRNRKIEVKDLFVKLDDDASTGVSEIVFEAAAVAPMKNGQFELEDILAEARPRLRQVDVLERLLGVNNEEPN